MQGDVDGRDGGGEGAAPFEVLRAVHLLPEGTAAHGVAAFEEAGEVPHGAGDGDFAADETGLAPAVDTLVGFYFDEHLVAGGDADGMGLYCGDAHGVCSPGENFRRAGARCDIAKGALIANSGEETVGTPATVDV